MAKIDDSVKKKVPELRFPGFTDDWEERKLGELSNIVGGGTPSTSNPEYWDGDIDWYAPADTNFSLKTLLSVNWETIPKGVRLSIGKQFLKEVNEGSIRAVKYVKKDSANTTIYKKTL